MADSRREPDGWEASTARSALWPAVLAALALAVALGVALQGGGDPQPGIVVEGDRNPAWPLPTPTHAPGADRAPRGAAPAPDWPAPAGARGVWASLPEAGVAGRADPVMVWTGARGSGRSEPPAGRALVRRAAYEPFVRGLVLVWGGYGEGGALADGAAYDPTTGLWRRIPEAPHPWSPGATAAAAWTGEELLVVVADEDTGAPAGIAYDPDTDRWRQTAAPPSELAGRHGAAWTGRELVVVSAGGRLAAAYRPGDDSWRRRPPAPVESDRDTLHVASLDEGLAVFGMLGSRPAVSLLSAGGASWSEPEPIPADGQRTVPTPAAAAAAAAEQRLVVVGSAHERSEYHQAWAWAPRAGWERLADLNSPPGNTPARLGWTDEEHLAWLGEGLLAGAVLEEGAQGWQPMTAPPLSPRSQAGAVWTGQTFVVWGGVGSDAFRSDGALFLP